MLRAWRSMRSLSGESAARSWLLTIARRELARVFERKRLDTIEIDAADTTQAESLAVDDRYDLHETRRAILQLDVIYREPLVLQVLFGCSTEEIARHLQISVQAVLTRLYRAASCCAGGSCRMPQSGVAPMNCDEFRIAVGAEPNSNRADLAAHAAECEQCAAYRRELQDMDGAIFRALSVDVIAAAPSRRPGFAQRRGWQLAAGLLLTVATALAIWIASPRESFAQQVLEHVRGEPKSLVRTLDTVPPAEQQQAAASARLLLMTVKLSDAATGETIAEPEFHQHAGAMGAAYSFGGTDKAMLGRTAELMANYLAKEEKK